MAIRRLDVYMAHRLVFDWRKLSGGKSPCRFSHGLILPMARNLPHLCGGRCYAHTLPEAPYKLRFYVFNPSFGTLICGLANWACLFRVFRPSGPRTSKLRLRVSGSFMWGQSFGWLQWGGCEMTHMFCLLVILLKERIREKISSVISTNCPDLIRSQGRLG